MTFYKPASELPRDRYGRPLITPLDGGPTEPYTRVTTFVGALEDTFNIQAWSMRMVALGMAKRTDLRLAAAAITDPKDYSQKRTLDAIAKSAKEAAGADEAANIGTALHSFTEKIDGGEYDTSDFPEEFAADLLAYAKVIEPFGILDVEGFCVCDELKVGGTYDRILSLPEEGLPVIDSDGEVIDHVYGNVIGDLKTGQHNLLGMGKIEQQLAVYSRSQSYDHTDGSRSVLPGGMPVNQRWGIVIDLPSGSGKATLRWADLERGWHYASKVVPLVREYRKKLDPFVPISEASATAPPPLTITERINLALTRDDLVALWRESGATWTPGQVALSQKRAAELG